MTKVRDEVFSLTDVSPYGVVGQGGNVAEFVNAAEYRADWAIPAFRGGTYQDDPRDAKVYFETRLQMGSRHEWGYVGFRAARPLPEGE